MIPFSVTDSILYEDNHLIAIYKPVGYLVQGDDTGDKPLSETLKQFIKERDQKPGNVFCGVIHRIDRPVSAWWFLQKQVRLCLK
jgi:23S rRNA pseudouridine1911/1915/1917 synthase